MNSISVGQVYKEKYQVAKEIARGTKITSWCWCCDDCVHLPTWLWFISIFFRNSSADGIGKQIRESDSERQRRQKKGPLRVKLPPTNKNNELGQVRCSFFSISFSCLSWTNNHIVLLRRHQALNRKKRRTKWEQNDSNDRRLPLTNSARRNEMKKRTHTQNS